MFKCNFYLNLSFDTKNYKVKYILFYVSRPVRDQFCLSPMLETKVVLFLYNSNVQCSKEKNPCLLTNFWEIHKKFMSLWWFGAEKSLVKVEQVLERCTRIAKLQCFADASMFHSCLTIQKSFPTTYDSCAPQLPHQWEPTCICAGPGLLVTTTMLAHVD